MQRTAPQSRRGKSGRACIQTVWEVPTYTRLEKAYIQPPATAAPRPSPAARAKPMKNAPAKKVRSTYKAVKAWGSLSAGASRAASTASGSPRP